MDDLLIGIKFFLFGTLIMLDVCPFYWRLAFDIINTEDDTRGFMLAVGPIFFEVLQ